MKHPDAELITRCQAFVDAERARDYLDRTADPATLRASHTAFMASQRRALDAIISMPGSTPLGLKWKARVLEMSELDEAA